MEERQGLEYGRAPWGLRIVANTHTLDIVRWHHGAPKKKRTFYRLLMEKVGHFQRKDL